MPIRFQCQRCKQSLAISSRKAGAEIRCPRCALPQVVPSEEAALAAATMSRRNPTDGPSVAADPEFVVYDDAPEPVAIPRPRRAASAQPPMAQPSPAQPSAAQASATQAEPPQEFDSLQTLPKGMILFHRRTFYVQALLLLILMVAAFWGGYEMGRGDAHFEQQVRQEQAERERIPIRGNLSFPLQAGGVGKDEGAVVIALPEGELPERFIPIDGIRPQDPPPVESHEALRMIEQLGGQYARADQDGKFYLVAPDKGTYWLLIISTHAVRPEGNDVDEIDFMQMKKYFDRPEDLINRYQYRWSAEEVTIGFDPITHHFGE